MAQIFIDAQQRRRRYLDEAKKQHKSRYIDRCLARKSGERGFVREWLSKDFHLKHIYQALNHMRYVLKHQQKHKTKIRLKVWLKRYQFYTSGVVSKIVKTFIRCEKAIVDNFISEGTNNKIKLIKRAWIWLPKG